MGHFQWANKRKPHIRAEWMIFPSNYKCGGK